MLNTVLQILLMLLQIFNFIGGTGRNRITQNWEERQQEQLRNDMRPCGYEKLW